MDDELTEWLPSRQQDRLAAAITRQLVDIERWLTLTPAQFLDDAHFTPADFLVYSSGLTRFFFTADVVHSYGVEGEQLSLVLLPEPATGDPFETPYRLSTYEPADLHLRSFLGKTCADVRIWRYYDAVPSDEAREAAVSYLFADETELFYVIYLHGDLDSDYLLSRTHFTPQAVASCYSLRRREYLQP